MTGHRGEGCQEGGRDVGREGEEDVIGYLTASNLHIEVMCIMEGHVHVCHVVRS